MGFPLADLVVESLLRDGFANARKDPEIIDDVFAPLTMAYANLKYGVPELDKIKNLIQSKQISIVHAFHAVDAKIACISIQLASDREDIGNTYLRDHRGTKDVEFTDPDKIAGRIIVADIDPIAYDPLTGALSLPDSVNLSKVNVNQLYVDAVGAEFVILGGVNNTVGQKQILIAKDQTVDLNLGGSINSSIYYDRYTSHITTEDFEVILGIHSKEPLITKYLYVLIKYFLLSRKDDACVRGMFLGSYAGSDFSRDMQYLGDQVYTRFLHISGKIQPTWRQDKVQLIDRVDVNILVPKDKYGNDILGLDDSNVQVTDD